MSLFDALLAKLGIRDYLPSGPVPGAADRDAWTPPSQSGVVYDGEPKVPYPVLPLQVWGVAYDLDIVLESTDARFDMHEYARLKTREGFVWLCKDALASTKLQSIIADVDGIEAWFPELPIERKQWPVEVEDRSTADWLDLVIRYENLQGEPVEVRYEGPPPRSAQRKRNGSTMGHSAAVAMAVLDIPFRDFGRRASVTIGGVEHRIRRLLGLVPIRVVLVQSQGGLSVGELVHSTSNGADLSVSYGPDVRTSWSTHSEDGVTEVRQRDGMRTLTYRFAERDGALELVQMQVEQYAVDHPVVTIALHPSLPDMRRPFEGRATSRFVVDMGDQRGHAVGRLDAWWDGDEAQVALLPEDPDWVTDRPMHTTIRYREGEAHVSIRRTPA